MDETTEIKAPIEAKPGCLRVTESYLCLEGEGISTGSPTFLVRLSGCNLRCWWCDSKFSSFDESEAKEVEWEILRDQALESGAPWISFTGGEPTFRGEAEMASLSRLCRALRVHGLKIKIETNGLLVPEALTGGVDLWSVSPKWDGSRAGVSMNSGTGPAGPMPATQAGEDQATPAMRFDLERLREFCRRFGGGRLQLKFVVTFDPQGVPKPSDLDRVRHILSQLPQARNTPILLVPEGLSKGADYLERCRRLGQAVLDGLKADWQGWDVRVLPQWHRVLYGEERKR